jgi:hypothetical protein
MKRKGTVRRVGRAEPQVSPGVLVTWRRPRVLSRVMTLLKEKSSYRPTRTERILAWVVTCASALAVLAFLARRLLGS